MEKSLSLDEKFNQNVLSVVCIVGLIRVFLEFDRNTVQSGILDFYLDISYGIIFIVTLIALVKKASYRFICYSFYVPLILLLCLTFIDRRGLASSTEGNIHIGLIVITLTMRGSDAWKYSFSLVIGMLISLVIVEVQYDFFQNYTDYSTSNFNFIFMGIGTIVVIFYAKKVFELRKNKLAILESDLSQMNQALDASRSELQQQTNELEELNRKLEERVSERAMLLNEQKAAMSAYLQLTLEELDKEHSNVQKATQKIVKNGEDQISELILESSEKLNGEIHSLMTKLKEER